MEKHLLLMMAIVGLALGYTNSYGFFKMFDLRFTIGLTDLIGSDPKDLIPYPIL